MAFINYPKREIQFKIAYCGAPSCGKTSNLEILQKAIQDPNKTPLEESDLEGERILSFQFHLEHNEVIEGFLTRFQLTTLPGTPRASGTYQHLLKGIDAVVFVVDSCWDRMNSNVESLNNLQESLVLNHVSLAQIPYILQYNKRDSEQAAPIYYLDYTFNNRFLRVMTFEAQARNGVGVVETFDAIVKLVLAKYVRAEEE